MMEDKITRLPLEKLHPFENHPYKVLDDGKMIETVESIKNNGVLVPIIIRPRDAGGYEIISGHRRHHASKLAGFKDIPAIVKDLEDDIATILLVDSNIQRENLLPSEKAHAYKMKMGAIKRQGKRTDLTLRRIGEKLNSADNLGKITGESARQIQRYIRLTELNPILMDMVDNKKIAFNAAVELSYLDKEQQAILLDVMEKEDCSPSLSQASQIKKACLEGKLNYKFLDSVLSNHKDEPVRLNLSSDRLKSYFPKSYTPQQMERVIFKLLDSWHKKIKREQQR